MNPLVTVLAGGAGATILLGLIDRIKNWKYDRRKQDSSIKLDEGTYDEIASRAEQTNSSNLMAVGAFWQGQFSDIEKRLAAEKDWRNTMTVKLRKHEAWDRKLMKMLAECDMHIDPPPSLDPDDDVDPPEPDF